MILPAPMLLSEDGRYRLGDPGWLLEVKWDGWRMIAGVKDGQARLITRGGVDVPKRFPEVAAPCAIASSTVWC